jgi:biotin transport system substrate-specific component
MSQTLPIYSPLRLAERTALLQTLAVAIGVGLLTASSYVSVPMFPVPMTMQTFAITLLAALYGKRLGTMTVIAWLAGAAFGLPVLANGAGGAAHFLGKTGGYLFAFPLMAWLVGSLAERGWNGRRAVFAFIAALLANALCLLIGGGWLAAIIGMKLAWVHGVLSFLLGALLKSVLSAATLKAIDIALPENKRAPTA